MGYFKDYSKDYYGHVMNDYRSHKMLVMSRFPYRANWPFDGSFFVGTIRIEDDLIDIRISPLTAHAILTTPEDRP